MSNLKAGDKEAIYTPEKLLDYMFDVLKKHLDINDISEFLEPSAGAGHMIDYLSRYNRPVVAYDILNELERDDITKCDFLKEKLEYKKGRVCFMNPPFSRGTNFIKKSLEISDYCVAILSSTTMLNLDYDKYIVDDITLIKKAQFMDGNDYEIVVMLIKKK